MKTIKIECADGLIMEYGVNDNGDGLWWGNIDGSFDQTIGTCDFSTQSAQDLFDKVATNLNECKHWAPVRLIGSRGW